MLPLKTVSKELNFGGNQMQMYVHYYERELMNEGDLLQELRREYRALENGKI